MELNNELSILEKYKLTPNELMTIKTLLLAQDNENEYVIRFNKILDLSGFKYRDLLISLQNKSIITKATKIPNSGETLILDNIYINKGFIKDFYKSSLIMGKELLDMYPMFGNIGDSVVPLKGIAKKFDSVEDFSRFYGKCIKWNPETHSKILNLIKWAKNNTTFLNCSISSFCINQFWNELEALKNGDISNVNFNAVKLV